MLMLGTGGCVQDAWESARVYFEMHQIRSNACARSLQWSLCSAYQPLCNAYNAGYARVRLGRVGKCACQFVSTLDWIWCTHIHITVQHSEAHIGSYVSGVVLGTGGCVQDA